MDLNLFKFQSKKTPEILTTNNYGMFKILNYNRSLTKLKKLRDSIKKDGMWPHSAIEIDQQNYLLDGQHRLSLCQEFGLPVNYIKLDRKFTDEERLEYIKQKNSTQAPWKLSDYVHAESIKKEKYREIIDFEERYKLGISNSITLCMGDSIVTRIVKAGADFKLNPKRNDCADFLMACRQLKHSRTIPFVRAVGALFRVGKVHHVKKLLKHHMLIPQMATKEAYLTVFANIINKHMRGDESKISF